MNLPTESNGPQSSSSAAGRPEEAAGEGERHVDVTSDTGVDYAILTLDTSGHVVSWSDGAERIKGYKAQEIIGKHFSRFYPEQDIQSGKPDGELVIASSEGYFEEEGWFTLPRPRAHHGLVGRRAPVARLREGDTRHHWPQASRGGAA